MAEFSERIKLARKRAGLNQTQLAEKVGLTQRSLSAYECGHVQPRRKMLTKLANALEVSEDYLTGKTPDLPEQNEDVEEIAELMRRNMTFFAGGDIPQAAKDAFFEALMTAYVECKNMSRARNAQNPQQEA